MFGSLGGGELVLVLVLALLLFGPRKLPGIGRTIGSALSEFRKATLDFKTSLEREVELDEVKSVGREITSAVDEVRDLGVPRGALLDGDAPRKPGGEPRWKEKSPSSPSTDDGEPPA